METPPVLVPPMLRWFHIVEVAETWVLVEVVQVVGRQVILLLAEEVMVTVLLVEEATVLVEEATVLVEEATAFRVEARAIQLEVQVIHLGVQALHSVDHVIHLEAALLPVLLAHLVQVVREEVEVDGILICMVDPTRVGL